MKTAEYYFSKYAEMDSNQLADRSKLMSKEEFKQAFGWRDKEIVDKIKGLIEREKKIQEGWNDEDFSYAIIQSGINRLEELLTFIEEK